MSAESALKRYYQRQLRQKRTTKKNKKPEADLAKLCLAWMRGQGWSVEIYEAKATFNPRAGRYMQQAMKAGVCDCQGVLPSGRALAVEFKAPGKLNTFNSERNYRQKQFILEKIDHNAFAVVADSLDRLKEIYQTWVQLAGDPAKKYLLSQLP